MRTKNDQVTGMVIEALITEKEKLLRQIRRIEKEISEEQKFCSHSMATHSQDHPIGECPNCRIKF